MKKEGRVLRTKWSKGKNGTEKRNPAGGMDVCLL
jgi:hypothetical protein